MNVAVDDRALAAFCERNGVSRLSFFGSVLRPDFGPASDVDVLVEFHPGSGVDLFDMVRMEDELSALLGRKVDLRTPEDLSRHFRAQVLREAEAHYAA